LGDSGSPLIQYASDSAVLIVVDVGADKPWKQGCSVNGSRKYAVRVSKHIDWIIDTINREREQFQKYW
jgi:hypothetical protein